MKISWVKTHWLIKKIFSNYLWEIPNKQKKVYLTFDDGPTPEITEWTLEQLKKYNAKATFFCIGKNIQNHLEIFEKISAEGHAIGNHTFNHLNGWKTSTEKYLNNVDVCANEISAQWPVFSVQHSKKTNCQLNTEHCLLFRPPYGKIKRSQATKLRKLGYKMVMWDVLSEDFDVTISKEKCLENVVQNVTSGSIVVFHDSIKAFHNLEYVLPRTLEFLKEKGFICERID